MESGISPRMFLGTCRPEVFSDSAEKHQPILDRSQFEYHLTTLTSSTDLITTTGWPPITSGHRHRESDLWRKKNEYLFHGSRYTGNRRVYPSIGDSFVCLITKETSLGLTKR